MKKVEKLIKKRTVLITMGLLFSLFVSSAGAGLIGQREVYIYACKEYATFYLTPPVGFTITDWDCINVESYDGGCDNGTYIDTTDNRLVIMVFSGGQTGLMGHPTSLGSYSATYRIYGYYVNSPPIADAGPDQIAEQENYDGIEVTLDGSGSTDPDSTAGTNDDIVSFDWYEGNTHLGSGETINYTFPVGSHTVSLVVTDSFGETDDDEVIIGVGPIGQREVYIYACKEYATFYLTPPVGFTITDWDCINVESYDGGCDNGTYIDTTDNRLVIMVFSGGQTGLMGHPTSLGSYSAMYHIYGYGNRPPTADAGPDQTVEQDSHAGASVPLDGSGSSDPDGDPLTYSWTWDGGSASGVSPTVVLPLGSTTITLVVNDGTADSEPDTVNITVEDTTNPTVDAGPDQTVTEGTPVTLNGSATDICDASLGYEWSESGTVLGNAATLTHTFPVGTHTVTLKATDDSGNGGTDTVLVTVVPVIPVAIDIKPGSYPNSINLESKGVIPIAILSDADFDATTVDPDTVVLAGAGVAVRGKSNKSMAHEEDVNGDGLTDLVVQVETEILDPGSFQDGYAVLTGETYEGVPIEGQDEITIVPPE